jgi:ADP-ribose pyrophosphatase YjhB (NUDIX family)
MKNLKTIKDSDFGLNHPAPAVYKEREASRAIVFDMDGNIALLHATKKHFHKLPGGGIEHGEDIAAALERELLEEIGCRANNVRELGSIEEYRNKFELHQVSYCFLANLSGDKGTPNLEEDEVADGFEPVWMSLEDAIKTLKSEADVEDYEGKFIQQRDLTFLQEASHKI